MKTHLSAAVLAASILSSGIATLDQAALAEEPRLDGILMIEIHDKAVMEAMAPGDQLVVFISDSASYGALVSSAYGKAGCQSVAVADSYTGRSISFGVPAELEARRQSTQTYCPPFKVTLEDADSALIEAQAGFNYSMMDKARGEKPPEKKWIASHEKIMAHVPLVSLDFSRPEFSKNDIKGTALGPVTDIGNLHRLSAPGYPGDRSKGYQRKPKDDGRPQAVIRGSAAASEITGWPWDVLYSVQQFSKLEQLSTQEAFREAVEAKYGKPSSMQDKTGYSLWVYDLEGKKLDLSAKPGGLCRTTADLWIHYDQQGIAQKVNWPSNVGDLGPWGCSVILELRPNLASGGVPSYVTRAVSGYVMAMNHFLQQAMETKQLLDKINLIRTSDPKL